MKTLILIPARGGSKRLPRKNIIDLNGKPLISYTIEAALASKISDDVYVSTEDEEIKKIAGSYNEIKIADRPIELASDKATVVDVALDLLNTLEKEGEIFDVIVMLMPTCPLRNAEDIVNAFNKFRSTNTDFLVSMTDYGWQFPTWALKENKGYLEPYFGQEYIEKVQEVKEKKGVPFCPSGAIRVANVAKLREHESIYKGKLIGHYMPFERAVDIDYETDLDYAKSIFGKLV